MYRTRRSRSELLCSRSYAIDEVYGKYQRLSMYFEEIGKARSREKPVHQLRWLVGRYDVATCHAEREGLPTRVWEPQRLYSRA